MWTTKPKSLWYKLMSYFSSLWNVFDLVVIVCMGVSVLLRYLLDGKDFDWARRMYSITIVLYYLRFLYVFYVSKNIGPKVIMIRRMVSQVSTERVKPFMTSNFQSRSFSVQMFTQIIQICFFAVDGLGIFSGDLDHCHPGLRRRESDSAISK